MAVRFENYTHSFRIKDKPVFAPTSLSREIGRDVKRRIQGAYTFEPFYFHLQDGGHVAALHRHRKNAFFCKVDLANFFYSIPRNRVVRCLKDIGVSRPVHYGKWSCVKNPYAPPAYSLPYGFVQSPILASLVLSLSEVGAYLSSISKDITVAVYVDDISLSANDETSLMASYEGLKDAVSRASFELNERKCVAPMTAIDVFNCSLTQGSTAVLAERIDTFLSSAPSEEGTEAFERYCSKVTDGNW